MIIRIFDIANGQLVPTEHCYTLKPLKAMMDQFPEQYMDMYKYVFYMTCPNPDLNPFFNAPEDKKEEQIMRYVNMDFSTDEPLIEEAMKMCRELYETPTYRAYRGIKIMLDNLAKLMETPITTGRDGNGPFLLKAATEFREVRESFKGVYNDLKEEQSSRTRGGGDKAYDQ